MMNDFHATIILKAHTFLVVVIYPLPWPLLVGGGGLIFPIVVHKTTFPLIWPVLSRRRGLSTHPGLTTWCVCGCNWSDDVCRVWVLQRRHSGDWCGLASTYLFVLSWTRVRRVKRGSISSVLIMCGGGVHSILLLPLVARCLETIDVCIWSMFVFMSVVVIVWGLWECLFCRGSC